MSIYEYMRKKSIHMFFKIDNFFKIKLNDLNSFKNFSLLNNR